MSPSTGFRRWLSLKSLTWALLIGLLLLCVVAGWGYWRWSSVPDYYREAQAQLQSLSEPARSTLAQRFENDTHNAFRGFAFDPDSRQPVRYAGRLVDAPLYKPQVFVVTLLELNAWLEQRFDAWRQNQADEVDVPETMSDFRVAVVDDRLHVGFRYRTQRINQVFTAVMTLKINEEGKCAFRVERVVGGKLRVPDALVRSRIERHRTAENSPAIDKMVEALEGTTFQPIAGADEQRRVRLLAIEMFPDRIELTYQFEPRPSEGP